jgi:hypothetical protein
MSLRGTTVRVIIKKVRERGHTPTLHAFQLRRIRLPFSLFLRCYLILLPIVFDQTILTRPNTLLPKKILPVSEICIYPDPLILIFHLSVLWRFAEVGASFQFFRQIFRAMLQIFIILPHTRPTILLLSNNIRAPGSHPTINRFILQVRTRRFRPRNPWCHRIPYTPQIMALAALIPRPCLASKTRIRRNRVSQISFIPPNTQPKSTP